MGDDTHTTTRRAALGALGALLSAGCLGAKRPAGQQAISTPEPTETPEPTDTPRPTETPEPTPTATPEPADTPEPGPSDEERSDGESALTAVDEALSAAVEAYVGDADAFEDVSAATDGFDGTAAFFALRTVQKRLGTADDAVVTDDQRSRLEDLRTVERFLTNATAAQADHVRALDGLEDVRDALEEDVERAESAFAAFESRATSLGTYLTTLRNETDGDAFAATDALDADVRSSVVTRFEGEAAAFDEADRVLDNAVDGWDDLEEAREAADGGDDEEAADEADSAREKLDGARTTLEELVDDPPEGSDAVVSVVESLLDSVDAKYETADDLYDDYA